MLHDQTAIEVHETCGQTVVRFKEARGQDDDWLLVVSKQLDSLINTRRLKSVSVDLQGVRAVPSSIVPILVVLWKKGVEVRLLSPPECVRETLTTMRLDDMFTVVDSLRL